MRRPDKEPEPDAMNLEDALGWIADALAADPAQVRPETLRTNLTVWDSLGQLVLMSALDQDFGIKLTREEVDSLTAVQDILDILDRHGRLRQ